MNIELTCFDGLILITPKVYYDTRGWFMEAYCEVKLNECGIYTKFVQDNHSKTVFKNTIRGLHLQIEPMAQTKLVRCTKGSILDVAVDLRKSSATYMKWYSAELSEDNKKQLYIPKGFAHGFLTLTDNTDVQYKVDNYYSLQHERNIKYDDPEISINWNTLNPILSGKDSQAVQIRNSDINFI